MQQYTHIYKCINRYNWCTQVYEKLVIVAVKIPKELKKKFKEKVKAHNTNMSVVLREFIEKYVNE